MARQIRHDDPARAAAHAPQHIPSGPQVDRNLLMPGYRERHDGWTQARTQQFLDALAHTGCARDAARVAGVSNQAGYRLRSKYPAFAAAWDAALARAQQGLIAIAYKRAVEGSETVIIRKGEEYERRISPSDAMLNMLVRRGDVGGVAIPEGHIVVHPDEVVTREEAAKGWFWDFNHENGLGNKRNGIEWVDTIDRLTARFAEMRKRMQLADRRVKQASLDTPPALRHERTRGR